ncbi:Very long-chain specific acyl-CoA dehydrogenase, mitochondrial, partial [Fragariocoptes setiger]
KPLPSVAASRVVRCSSTSNIGEKPVDYVIVWTGCANRRRRHDRRALIFGTVTSDVPYNAAAPYSTVLRLNTVLLLLLPLMLNEYESLTKYVTLASFFAPQNMTEARESAIKAHMTLYEDKYTDSTEFRIFVGSWNVNGQSPCASVDLWLTCDPSPPDIYAIGFQEIDLSREAFLFNDTPREGEWLQACAKSLHPKASYVKVKLIRLIGMMLIVFVRKELEKYVTNVAAETVGTGIMRKMGNKGGVAIRLDFHNTSICFVNSHLAAHVEEYERRNQDFHEICSRIVFNQFHPPKYIKDHEQIYWLGDLNYRIDELSTNQIKAMINKNALEDLLVFDQLKKQNSAHRVFVGFKEPPIRHWPTYKYDPGTNNWDSSEKNRPPAWCDRILWRGGPTQPLLYRSHPKLLLSDHKPISCLFSASIKVVDNNRYRRVYEDLMKKLDRLENESLPQVSLDRLEFCFKNVLLSEPKIDIMTVANTGQVPVYFSFIKKLNDSTYCKSWLQVSPFSGLIMPGDTMDVELRVCVLDTDIQPNNLVSDNKECNNGHRSQVVMPQESKSRTLDDILVLHLDRGKDFFITVTVDVKTHQTESDGERDERDLFPLDHFTRKMFRIVNGVVASRPRSIPSVFCGIRHQSQALKQKPADQPVQPDLQPRKRDESSSFIMNMFAGNANFEQVFPYPSVLTPDQYETLSMVLGPTEKFWQENNDPLANDAREKIDEKLWESLKPMGAFGIQVPTEYGGVGFNNTQYARMAELMGGNDLAIGIALGSHQSIGFKGILLYGNEEQKQKYLPDLAVGKRIACFCLTEPGSGSDAGSIRTKAEMSPDGKHWLLNGSKIWISNGGIADVFTVFAKTPVKDEKTGEMKDKITAFIVERKFGGLTSTDGEKKMGIKASNTATVNFDNCPVPVENVLGPVGGGFKVAMNILNSGRFGMGAALSGCMRTQIQKAIDHATQREQFGSKINTFGAIQEKIARMSVAHYTTESMAYMVSSVMDRGYTDFQCEAAISKVFSSEAAWFVTDETIQILGGMGFMRSSGVEKVMRDLRIFRIFEGTNDILRLFVALSGAQYAGGHLKELQKAMSNPVGNLGMIMEFGTKKMKRAVGMSSGPSLSQFVSPKLRDSAALVSRAMEQFDASVEYLLIKFGKNIIHQQFLLNRLANSAIDIYACTCVLSRATRTEKLNLKTAEHEINMVRVICNEASDRISANLSAIRAQDKLKNYDLMKRISDEVCNQGGVVQLSWYYPLLWLHRLQSDIANGVSDAEHSLKNGFRNTERGLENGFRNTERTFENGFRNTERDMEGAARSATSGLARLSRSSSETLSRLAREGYNHLPSAQSIMRIPDKAVRAEAAMIRDGAQMARKMLRNTLSAVASIPADLEHMYEHMRAEVNQ